MMSEVEQRPMLATASKGDTGKDGLTTMHTDALENNQSAINNFNQKNDWL